MFNIQIFRFTGAKITYFFFFCLYLIFYMQRTFGSQFLPTPFPSQLCFLLRLLCMVHHNLFTCLMVFSYIIVACIISLSLFVDECMCMVPDVCIQIDVFVCAYMFYQCGHMNRNSWDFLFINGIKYGIVFITVSERFL